MTAKQLLPRLRHLMLVGVNEKGELLWMGTLEQWQLAEKEEKLNELIN